MKINIEESFQFVYWLCNHGGLTDFEHVSKHLVNAATKRKAEGRTTPDSDKSGAIKSNGGIDYKVLFEFLSGLLESLFQLPHNLDKKNSFTELALFVLQNSDEDGLDDHRLDIEQQNVLYMYLTFKKSIN